MYAVADAESSVDPKKLHHNPAVKGKHGHVIHPPSTDFGVMQINRSNIGGTVKDANGHPFKIGKEVERDWKANARAGVALLAPAYGLAEVEQGPSATAEDHAQQAYSQYNSGKPRMRDRYLKQRPDGMPENGADRNFLERYRAW